MCTYTGQATWSLRGSTTYTSHKYVSRTKTLSRHQRMNLQHAVQHLLNISLTRLHTNKPAGTWKLTPTPAYFDIVPALQPRAKRTCSFAFAHVWNALTIFNSECLCSNVCFCCTNNRIIISFTNKLEYVNYCFFPEKGGVRINRVYELLEILQWL